MMQQQGMPQQQYIQQGKWKQKVCITSFLSFTEPPPHHFFKLETHRPATNDATTTTAAAAAAAAAAAGKYVFVATGVAAAR